ncbi:hypothetical protein [Nocardia jejuensis]|uniref:hypothetical protein n=1 Tax=Nocardia jejuensis TaxID=328049 RepID=UPI00082FF33F|nr:hypothetical protein [Nocardia jejuensis]
MEAEDPDRPLEETEREELTRLRGELEILRAERTPDTAGAVGVPQLGRRSGLRWTGVALLLIVVAVLGLSSVLARFARGELLDTDRYVQTVTPLGSDQEVRDGLADRITDAIMDRLDVENVTATALTAITESAPRVPPAVVGLAPVVQEQAEQFVHETAESVLASDDFEALWIQVNRQAHRGVVAVLNGDTRAAVGMDEDGTVSVSLGPIIDKVRIALTERGFTFAERVPAIDRSFVLFRAPELVTAQRWVSVLDRAAGVLPWATLLVAAGAVWAAPKGARRRAFSGVGVALAVAMALLAVALGIGRSEYLRAIPADVLSAPVAATLIDAVLVPLRTTMRAVFVLAVVIAAAGFLTGSSRSAVAIRGAYTRTVARARSHREDREPSAIEAAIGRFRGPLRAGIVALAAITLVFWRYPTGLVVIVTVVVAIAALLVVELLGGRPGDAADATVEEG